MALIECSFRSAVLGLDTSVVVVRPDEDPQRALLYLLHGWGDDHTAWLRNTAIERYACDTGVTVVMPDGAQSYFRDEYDGRPYFTYLSRELPVRCHRLMGIDAPPARTAVAGLSMGGYGALHWALQEPARFAAAASLSGVLDVAAVNPDDPRRAEYHDQWLRVFGPGPLASGPADLLALLARAEPGSVPPLHLSCGESDERIAHTVRFATAARARVDSVTVQLAPGGHDWNLWDPMIGRVLDWLVSTIA